MPSASDSEEEAVREMREFIGRRDAVRVELDVGASAEVEAGGTDVGLTLTGLAVVAYAWGGCGNNIGTQAALRIRLGRARPSDVLLGPRPGVLSWGPVRLALAEAEPGAARAVVTIAPA